MKIEKGNPSRMGCERTYNGINFSFSSDAEGVALLLYSDIQKRVSKKIELGEEYRTGNVFSVLISDWKDADRYYYCYEVNGKRYVDPYAKAVTGCGEFGVEEAESIHMSPVCIPEYDWEGDKPLQLPYNNCIFYKMNVRGFTRSRTSKVRDKGTFKGILEKTGYLKELGITTIELQPAYEFDEAQRFPQLYEQTILAKYAVDKKYMFKDAKHQPVNYWGYTRGFYYAPKAAFSSNKGRDYINEFKDMVKALHKEGIEVVMEMFFERESLGFIRDCVCYWINEYHIDGVHIYSDSEAAVEMLSKEAVLADTKIITVYWSGEKGSRKHFANYNSDFQNIARRFLKGDENMLGEFSGVFVKNVENSASINYIANNNGFTLNDLVSYDRKHNEPNGESNRDGENFNYSWNCGEEGATRKKKIKELRIKQMKNALMMVLLSSGTPLLMAGDEICNSQNGNNNPYCIDDESSWVNWKDNAETKAILEWTRKLIAFRKANRILHMPEALTFNDRISCGYPDVSYHGSNAWYADMQTFNRHMGIMFSSVYGNPDEKKLIYIGFNMHWEEHDIALPGIELNKDGTDCGWKVIFNSEGGELNLEKNSRTVKAAPRSIVVLEGRYNESEKIVRHKK